MNAFLPFCSTENGTVKFAFRKRSERSFPISSAYKFYQIHAINNAVQGTEVVLKTRRAVERSMALCLRCRLRRSLALLLALWTALLSSSARNRDIRRNNTTLGDVIRNVIYKLNDDRSTVDHTIIVPRSY